MMIKSMKLFPFLLLLFLFASCNRKQQPTTIDDDPTQEIPVDQIVDAPADQIEALTEVAVPDSTDVDFNFSHPGSYIYVSKPHMRLYVIDANDSVLFSCGIACGLRKGNKEATDDYKTPEGHFSIAGMFDSTDWIHKRKDGREVKGCYGPYFLRLRTGKFTGIGIHGTNAPGSIGRRASEGCIRVNSSNIVILHDEYAYEGMPVIVSGERERLPEFLERANEAKPNVSAHSSSDSLSHFSHDTTAVSKHQRHSEVEATSAHDNSFHKNEDAHDLNTHDDLFE